MKKLMRKISFDKQLTRGQGAFLTFAIGGVGYGLLELLWRGHTHISMVITGGVCLMIIREVYHRFSKTPLILRGVISSGMITAVELVVGCVVNIALGLHVWDYSGERFDLLGQICPFYSMLWFVICVFIMLAISAYDRAVAAK